MALFKIQIQNRNQFSATKWLLSHFMQMEYHLKEKKNFSILSSTHITSTDGLINAITMLNLDYTQSTYFVSLSYFQFFLFIFRCYLSSLNRNIYSRFSLRMLFPFAIPKKEKKMKSISNGICSFWFSRNWKLIEFCHVTWYSLTHTHTLTVSYIKQFEIVDFHFHAKYLFRIHCCMTEWELHDMSFSFTHYK